MSGIFNGIKNRALNVALGIADTFTPVLKESKFRETGFITPEEFVAAGDFLTGHCPTWQWAPASSPKASKDYLPADKQFLITKNVPCTKRCRHLMECLKYNQEKVVEEGTGDGGWVDTHYSMTDPSKLDSQATIDAEMASNKVHLIVDENEKSDDEEVDLNELKKKATSMNNAENEDEDDDDEEAVDMETFDHNIIEEDDQATVLAKPSQTAASDKSTSKAANKPDEVRVDDSDNMGVSTLSSNAAADDDTDVFVSTRTYDLHITYDNYYRTPRLWLSGYDENKKPLTIEQMYDDISEDHAKKTVTFEAHPHVPGVQMASIHPCRHADVMKKLINLVAESGKELEVYSYLMIFLKFVQSVIPTIEYDYTRNFSI